MSDEDRAVFQNIGPIYPKGPVCGAPTSFPQWANLNLGFSLHQADAAESAYSPDGAITVPDGTWIIRTEKERYPRTASPEEVVMWKQIQQFWIDIKDLQESVKKCLFPKVF